MKIKNILILSLAFLLVGCERPDFVRDDVTIIGKSQESFQKVKKSARYTMRFRSGIYYSDYEFELPEDFGQVGQRVISTNKNIIAVD